MAKYYQHIGDLVQKHREEEGPPQPPQPFLYGSILRKIWRILVIGVVSLLLMAAITYVTDYVVLRFRIARQQNGVGQVTVNPYTAIKLKSGKTDFIFQPPQIENCANSLFPHLGMRPCWYERRHPEKRTDY